MCGVSLVIIDVEKKNFENLVYIYRSNLRRLVNGRNVYAIFTSRERKRLLKDGVIKKVIQGLQISDKAMKILSNNDF